MAKANSSATTITANSIIEITINIIASMERSGIPIILDDARYPMANNNPKICKITPTPVIVATPSHFPSRSSFLVHGKLSKASNVPLSRSPAVISIEGWIALEKVQTASTNGINRDNTIPACSPWVATSPWETSPSHLTGLRVEFTSRPCSEIIRLVSLFSQVINPSMIRLLASFELSDVEICMIA